MCSRDAAAWETCQKQTTYDYRFIATEAVQPRAPLLDRHLLPTLSDAV